MNESPLFHSSANRPLSRKSPSELPLPPAVAALRRPIAPSAHGVRAGGRLHVARVDDVRILDLQDFGRAAAGEREGAGERERRRRAGARASAGDAASECMYRIIGVIILEAEGETDGVVARRRERLELRRGVARAGGAERLRIHARVLRPEHAEVARSERGGEAVAADVPGGPLLRRREGEVQLAEADEVAVLDEAGNRLRWMTRAPSPCAPARTATEFGLMSPEQLSGSRSGCARCCCSILKPPL